jgi:hypothetical protein
MKIGDLVKDTTCEMVGIIIHQPHFGDMYHSGEDKTDWSDFGVLYEDGQIYGAHHNELEEIE